MELQPVRRETGSFPAAPHSGGSGTGRSRAIRRGRSSDSVACADCAVGADRQQLRRDQRVDDVQQRRAGLALELVAGGPLDQELHQRLGDAAVGVVHAHVIAVVRTPAQGRLGHVAGADHEAAVHEDAGAHPGLDVLEDRGPRGRSAGRRCSSSVNSSTVSPVQRRMPNGWCPSASHLLQAQRPDVDLARRDAEMAHQGAGVVARAVAGAEAGHA